VRPTTRGRVRRLHGRGRGRDGRARRTPGVDIVSDGETSKISYATYVKDRYTGFDGDSPRNAPADLKLFPSFLERLADDGGTPKYARPMCVGEVKSKGQGELEKDIANLQAAMAAHGVERGFMNAASPGVISLFLQNDFYPTREAYLAALADAMKAEYETIVAAGLDLQLDCPDLALSAPHAVHRSVRRGVREGRGQPMSRR
jgi:5-methyltetrahydropteroyltriglutamate--homocysteine methyltransferase